MGIYFYKIFTTIFNFFHGTFTLVILLRKQQLVTKILFLTYSFEYYNVTMNVFYDTGKPAREAFNTNHIGQGWRGKNGREGCGIDLEEINPDINDCDTFARGGHKIRVVSGIELAALFQRERLCRKFSTTQEDVSRPIYCEERF